eukprot:1357254-Amorphochlora_amoeboformis.AAC.1
MPNCAESHCRLEVNVTFYAYAYAYTYTYTYVISPSNYLKRNFSKDDTSPEKYRGAMRRGGSMNVIYWKN